jgi:hypothetical protein
MYDFHSDRWVVPGIALGHVWSVDGGRKWHGPNSVRRILRYSRRRFVGHGRSIFSHELVFCLLFDDEEFRRFYFRYKIPLVRLASA